MFIIMWRCVACKTHDYMSKVKVTLRGKKNVIFTLFKFIVTFLYNLVKIFVMMSRHVAYETCDSMSKVKVTLKGKKCVIYA